MVITERHAERAFQFLIDNDRPPGWATITAFTREEVDAGKLKEADQMEENRLRDYAKRLLTYVFIEN